MNNFKFSIKNFKMLCIITLILAFFLQSISSVYAEDVINFTDVNFTSGRSTAVATKEDTLTFSSKITEDVKTIGSVYFKDDPGKDPTGFDVKLEGDKLLINKTITEDDIKVGKVQDGKKIILVINYQDKLGVSTDYILPEDKAITFELEATINSVTFGPNFVMEKEHLTFTFTTNHMLFSNPELTEAPNAVIDGKTIPMTSSKDVNGYKYEVTKEIEDREDLSEISASFADNTLYDGTGHKIVTESYNPTNKAVFLKDLTIDSLSFQSDNKADDSTAVNGNNLKVSFKTSRRINIENTPTINQQEIKFYEEAQGTSYIYSATLKINDTMFSDDDILECSNIEVKDISGKKQTVMYSNSIKYIGPFLVNNHIAKSSNKINNVAVNNDVITVTFEANRALMITGKVTIAKTPVNYIESKVGEIYVYTATHKITTNDSLVDDSVIPIDASSVKVKDQCGNKEQNLPTLINGVKYYTPIIINDMDLKSNNSNNQILINGNESTFSFKTTHKVTIDGTIKLGNMPLSFEEKKETDNTYSYIAKLIVQQKMFKDNSEISLNFDGVKIKDAYGNPEISFPIFEKKLNYYAPFEIGKNINNLQIETTTNTENQAGDKLVKDGDIITITFESNRVINKPTGTLDKQSLNFESLDGKKWKTQYTVKKNTFKDNDYINFNLELSDNTGNAPITLDQMDFSAIRYMSAIEVKEFNYTSSNKKDPQTARAGDIITITAKTNHRVSVKEAYIGNSKNALSFRSEDGVNWIATYSVDKTTFEDLAAINFLVRFEDAAKNPVVTKNESELTPIVYYGDIGSSDFSYLSNNKTSNLAIDGNTLRVSFKTKHPIEINDTVMINGKQLAFSETKEKEHYIYTARLEIKPNTFEDDTSLQCSNIKISDKAGNEFIFDASNPITYYAPIVTTNTVAQSDHLEKPYIAIDEDTIHISFTTNHQVSITGKVKIAGDEVELKSIKTDNGYEHSLDYKIISANTLTDDKEIPIDLNAIKLNDVANNKEVTPKSAEHSIFYYAPISVKNLSIATTNANPGYLINGNMATFSFETTHSIQLDGTVKLGNQTLNMTENKNDVRYIYKGSLNITDGMYNDQEVVSVLLDSIKIKDAYDNNTINFPEFKNILIYYAPFELDKNVTNIDLKTTNSGRSPEGIQLVRDGDKITLSFNTSRNINEPTGNINGKNLNFKSENGRDWSSVFTVSNGYFNDSQVLPFTFNISDNTGNDTLSISNNNFQAVQYYAPLEFTNKNYYSNNSVTPMVQAKNGDVVTVEFSTNHPINLVDAYIGTIDNRLDITSNDGVNWKGYYTVSEGLTSDQNIILCGVGIGDNAGNEVIGFSQNDMAGITYFAPIQLSNLVLASTNSNDPNLYAKNGDSISARFNSNHHVSVVGTINGGEAALNESYNGNTGEFTFTKSASGMQDMSYVTFTASAIDTAGNAPFVLSQDNINNRIQYFAPIVASSNMTATSVKNPQYIKNGSTITTRISANHPVTLPSTSIQGRSCDVAGNETESPAATYVIPEGESSMPEGKIEYTIGITDKAGNTQTVNTNSENYIYDRTIPSVKIDPVVFGFFNKPMEFVANFQDTNIDPADTQFKLNGLDQGGTTGNKDILTKSITLSKDEEYAMEAISTDMAGNTGKNGSSKVIIDQTNPKIKTIDLDLEKTPVYKAGFVIAQHFNIDEKYLKNVSCTLTDKTGIGQSKAWNIDNPINDEGLKNMVLTATDMADNASEQIKYNFYIDATAPKPIVKDTSTALALKSKEISNFAEKADIVVELDQIWMGDEKPDHITKLQVVDNKNNVVSDGLKGTMGETSTGNVKVSEKGDYKLIIEAQDDVENKTDTIVYRLSVKDKEYVNPVAKNNVQNNPQTLGIWIASIAASICVIGLIVALYMLNRKKKIKQTNK